SPTNGANFKADLASVQISASASDVDGAVRRLDFYAGTGLIGTLSNAPYTFTWTRVAPGSYTLTARATDDVGTMATSGPVAITVTANTGLPYGVTDRTP